MTQPHPPSDPSSPRPPRPRPRRRGGTRPGRGRAGSPPTRAQALRRRARATLAGVGVVVLAFGAVAFAVQPDPSLPPIPVEPVPLAMAAPAPTPPPPTPAPAPTAPEPAPAPPPEPVAPARTPVGIAAVGDISMGSVGYALPPNAGAGFFDPVAELLAADVTVGNLEGPLTDGADATKCPPPPPPGADAEADPPGACFAFRTPTDHAPVLAEAGFDVLSLANNHAYDFGPQGAADTQAALAGVGVATTGLAEAEIPVVRVGDTRVAVLGFAPYPFADPLLDLEAAQARVAEAAAMAELVVVSVHMGAEGTDATSVTPGPETYLGEDRGDPMAFARATIDAGADLVVGHGPHVLRGMEVYEGRLVAYSLGNFSGYGVFALDGPLSEGVVLQVRLAPDGAFRQGRLLPTQLVGEGGPAPGGTAIDTVRALSEADFGAAAPRIDADGRIRPPAPGAGGG